MYSNRLTRTSANSSTESLRAIAEVLFVDRLQQHEHSSLQKFVFERGDSDLTFFAAVAFRNLDPTHRWCSVGSRSDTLQQRLQIGTEIYFVVGSRLAIDSPRAVFTRAAIGFAHPLDINQVSQAREYQSGRRFRQ